MGSEGVDIAREIDAHNRGSPGAFAPTVGRGVRARRHHRGLGVAGELLSLQNHPGIRERVQRGEVARCTAEEAAQLLAGSDERSRLLTGA